MGISYFQGTENSYDEISTLLIDLHGIIVKACPLMLLALMVGSLGLYHICDVGDQMHCSVFAQRSVRLYAHAPAHA